ncbi:MAG: hypothetical protein IKY78_04260 [Clostridia bacterium]|nr:hypothetical protein [Clostridia bacterium]
MTDSVTLVLEKEFAEELFEAICEIADIDDTYELISLDTFNVLSELRESLAAKLVLEE